MNKAKIEEFIKEAEKVLNSDEMNDQDKYLINQKVETLKSLN